MSLKYSINLIDPRIFSIPKALGTRHFYKGKGDLKIKKKSPWLK